MHDVDARFGKKPTRSMEVIGYDSARRKYLSRSYDDQGSSEVFAVALKGRTAESLEGPWRSGATSVNVNNTAITLNGARCATNKSTIKCLPLAICCRRSENKWNGISLVPDYRERKFSRRWYGYWKQR